MAVSVQLPRSGMGIQEGTIVKWLKADGERVAEGDPIVEVETVKATQEIEAPASGILRTLYGDGETLEVGIEIATIEEE